MLEFSEVNHSCFLSVQTTGRPWQQPSRGSNISRWEVKGGLKRWNLLSLSEIICMGRIVWWRGENHMQGEFQSCHFANKGWIVYILTVLSDSVYPAGSTSSAHWARSPLFIHSFPRGQVLSLWWMGAGTGQLFSLDGTSLTRSELKRPPCQRSSAIPLLFRGPRTAANVLTRMQTPAPHRPCLTSLGLFLLESTWGIGAVRFNFISTAQNASCQVEIMESAPAFQVSGVDVTMVDVWRRCGNTLAAVAAVLVALLTATRELWKLVCISEAPLVKVCNIVCLSKVLNENSYCSWLNCEKS